MESIDLSCEQCKYKYLKFYSLFVEIDCLWRHTNPVYFISENKTMKYICV
jgi:hypothetical protein